jgi:carboxypeptidase family protein
MCSLAHLLILISLPSLQTQPDTTARIIGHALSAYNGRPLAGVMIVATAVQRFTVADAKGAFMLTGLPSGPQRLRVSYNGRNTDEYEFELRAGRTTRLAVVLDTMAKDLAPLVVEARFVDVWRDLAGFYERRQRYGGFARFFTREDIERSHLEALSVLLKGAGIFTWCLYTCLPTRFSHGHICSVPVSLDGLPIWERDLDRIPIENVAGVEIYREPPSSNPFGVPLINQFGFEGKDLIQGRGDCGSVGIWTR